MNHYFFCLTNTALQSKKFSHTSPPLILLSWPWWTKGSRSWQTVFPFLQNQPVSFSCFIMKSVRFDRMNSSVRRNLIPFFIYLREIFLLYFIRWDWKLAMRRKQQKNKQPGEARADASHWWNVFWTVSGNMGFYNDAELKEVILIIVLFSNMYFCQDKKIRMSPNNHVQNCDKTYKFKFFKSVIQKVKYISVWRTNPSHNCVNLRETKS